MSPHCQVCGRAVPTGHVRLMRNIGVVVMRFRSTTEGWMCRPCAVDKWLSEMALTLLFGWWGVISFFVNIISVINNLAQLPGVLGIPAPDPRLDRTGVPSTGKVLWGIGGAGALGLVGLLAAGAYLEGADRRRLESLREELEEPRKGAGLTEDTACKLAEEFLLARDGRAKDFSCSAAKLEANAQQALLAGVAIRDGQASFCLRRGGRWFVAADEPCAKAALSAQAAKLPLAEQERQWQKEELSHLLAEARTGLDGKLAAVLHEVRRTDIPSCSAEVLTAVSKDALSPFLTVDEALLSRRGDEKDGATEQAAEGDAAEEDARGDRADGALELVTSPSVRRVLEPDTEGYRGQLDELRADIKHLDKTRYLGVVGRARLYLAPEVKSSKEFSGAIFAGTLYLADLQQGAVLCARTLAFENAENLTFRSAKHASEAQRVAAARRSIDEDLATQFSLATDKWVDEAFLSQAELVRLDQPKEEPAPTPAPLAKPAAAPRRRPLAKAGKGGR